MKTSFYSTIWGLEKYGDSFDMDGAFANWSLYADEISIACGDDYSFEYIEKLVEEKKYPVVPIKTSFDFKNDGLAYGRTLNAALQACTGDILIEQDSDERFLVNPNTLWLLGQQLLENPNAGAYFIPTIDLYGSYERYASLGKKWYCHKEGYFRGPVNFGFKADGRINYSKSSTDELIDRNSNLVPTIDLLPNMTIESLREYVKSGMPISFHLGYCNLNSRAKRAEFWKKYWHDTTGDENNHITDIEELEKRETKEHKLPLWSTRNN